MSSLLLLMSANGCIGDEVGESRYGGFRPVKSSPARLVAETLSVVLEANRASFKARYWVDNPGDTLRSKYGVPIDHTPASMAMDDIGWEPRLFSDSRLSIDGQPAVAMDSGRETKTVFTLPRIGIPNNRLRTPLRERSTGGVAGSPRPSGSLRACT
ncbi:MAG: hypothetical protein IPK50_00165 [Fibrobacterota bacterium]|nr:MAG: hypothetical protein IPK50_00165 [Fibrobacterota bacterium]